MSSQVISTPRSALNARQVETVSRLLDAAERVLNQVGPDELTIRMVASEAGVSAATAYTYLASKFHLYAELYWRHIQAHPVDQQALSAKRTSLQRVQQVVAELVAATEKSPTLAAAANQALLSRDPNVERLRLRIGAEFVARLEQALGSRADAALIDALAMAFSGALLQVGMELMTYEQLGERLKQVIAVIMKGHP
ncbi:MAG TPA: helix-turn-helix domain-containing protein [Marmoricola sp.]|nr:helix-turn-helix domain-containing protein [Marmoricola sp.]